MTPTQLRAFAAVVRLGSVKAAAGELGVSEAAVSMHVGQLRKEFDDILFTRTGSGLAFTPGGLRLASRAVEILGLQDRTAREVSQAGHGKRVLRIAATHLFAEHAAPGLIELFAGRAADLEVELSVRPVEQFAGLLASRAVDVAIGPAVSSFAGLVAAALPAGARVLCAEEDFTSVLFPFLAQERRGVRVELVPAARVPEALGAEHDLVAVSAVQSATGQVCDLDALVAYLGTHENLSAPPADRITIVA